MKVALDPRVAILGLSRGELVVLVDSLLERLSTLEGLVQQLQEENGSLRAENAALSARIKELMDKQSKDSHNSSKPPSSDGLAKKPSPKSLRQSGTRPSGGQPGHPGSTLAMSETPDLVIVYNPALCGNCGADLKGDPCITDERRQVFDLPEIKLDVTEHRVSRIVCVNCGTDNTGEFPGSVTGSVQYGERIKSAIVYLNNWQLLPWERTSELMGDFFGCSISEGVLQSALRQCEQSLIPITERIKETLGGEDIAHFDETGQRVAGKLHWLHVAATDRLTYYATHGKRGREATDEIGILPVFSGRAIHDGWKPYLDYECNHGLCNAHHLRELTFLAEEEGQIWAYNMKTLLTQIKNKVDSAREAGLIELDTSTLHAFEDRYNTEVKDALIANPEAPRSARRGRVKQSKGRNLALRLRDGRDETLAFMYDFRVPFDNNLAERDVRMMKVRQKVSGCFRTIEGAEMFGCIRGYLSTMRKQGHNALAVIQTIFQGQPRSPDFA